MCSQILKTKLNGFKKIVKVKKCISSNEVTQEFIEPFITKGYRQANQPFIEYIKSIFHLNNETFNFWTHFVPFSMVSFYVIYFYSRTHLDIYYLPYFIYIVSVSCYLLMSSIAHMLNSMSSTSRQLCFIMDYLGNP